MTEKPKAKRVEEHKKTAVKPMSLYVCPECGASFTSVGDNVYFLLFTCPHGHTWATDPIKPVIPKAKRRKSDDSEEETECYEED